jgi:hypothetical protein
MNPKDPAAYFRRARCYQLLGKESVRKKRFHFSSFLLNASFFSRRLAPTTSRFFTCRPSLAATTTRGDTHYSTLIGTIRFPPLSFLCADVLSSLRGLEAYENFQRALVTRPLAAEYLYGRARSHLARGMGLFTCSFSFSLSVAIGLIEDAWQDVCAAVQSKPLTEFLEGQKQIGAMRTPKRK